MHRVSHQGLKFLLFPTTVYDRSRLILPNKRRTFEIEHTTGEVRDLGGLWRLSDSWPKDDGECSVRATMAGEVRRRTGRLLIAGIPAFEYIYQTPGIRVIQRMAFAPSLGCDVVEASISEWNSLGLPVGNSKLVLVSVTIGEPAESAFEVPSGYRLVAPDTRWPHVYLDTFPGHITTTSFSTPVE